MKKCEQALLLIYSHALDIVGGQRSVRIASPSLPPHHGSPAMEEESSDRPWQGTGAVGKKGPSHPDDTLRGALQPIWRTESPWMLDCCDEEAGKEK